MPGGEIERIFHRAGGRSETRRVAGGTFHVAGHGRGDIALDERRVAPGRLVLARDGLVPPVQEYLAGRPDICAVRGTCKSTMLLGIFKMRSMPEQRMIRLGRIERDVEYDMTDRIRIKRAVVAKPMPARRPAEACDLRAAGIFAYMLDHGTDIPHHLVGSRDRRWTVGPGRIAEAARIHNVDGVTRRG